jgi:hypothetical protein
MMNFNAVFTTFKENADITWLPQQEGKWNNLDYVREFARFDTAYPGDEPIRHRARAYMPQISKLMLDPRQYGRKKTENYILRVNVRKYTPLRNIDAGDYIILHQKNENTIYIDKNNRPEPIVLIIDGIRNISDKTGVISASVHRSS